MDIWWRYKQNRSFLFKLIVSAFGSGDTAGLYYNGARLAAEQDVVVASIKLAPLLLI